MAVKVLTLLAALQSAAATELTSANWEEQTAGKSVFIKFQAPWWGHCKKLKPDWDKLMGLFKDSKTALVADVDCTADGKALCSEHGIRGYPTIKHGNPAGMEDYKGGRTFDALKQFADENLGPTCGPDNLDLCDEEKKTMIEKFQAMSSDDLDAAIKEKNDSMEKLESDFKAFVETLNKQYGDESKKKDAGLEEIKNSGMGMMKSVQAYNKKKKAEL